MTDADRQNLAAYAEACGDALKTAADRAAQIALGTREAVGAEREIAREQAAAAIAEALGEAIAATDDTLTVALSGDVTVVAEIVPEGVRSGGEIRLRAGRTLPVATLHLPGRGEPWRTLLMRGRLALLTSRREGERESVVDGATGDAEGRVTVRGATPHEEYVAIRLGDGTLVLRPLSRAQELASSAAPQPSHTLSTVRDGSRLMKSYLADHKREISSAAFAVSLGMDEGDPDVHAPIMERIESALVQALSHALENWDQPGVSVGVEDDVVIGIPRGGSKYSVGAKIEVQAAQLTYKTLLPPHEEGDARGGGGKRRKRG